METGSGNTKLIPYVDTHAHLAMLDHAPLEEVLERARLQGIQKMVSVSTDEGSWESNRNLALRYPHIYYTIGIHPHDSIRWAECAAHMSGLFANGVPEKCVGVGELGLDYHYDFSPRDVQLDVLEAQFTIAKQVDLPIIIHCRDAFDDLYERIRTVGISPRGGVMHCFTGDATRAKQAVDLGLMISFSGILTFKNAGDLREAAKIVPEDRLLVETDCPFLAPIPMRGKPNEPAFLPLTAQTLAALRGKKPLEIGELTTANAIRFFGLAP